MSREDNKNIWNNIIVNSYTILRSLSSKISSFCVNNTKTRKNVVLVALVNRIAVNLRAVFELSGLAYKKEGIISYKFPVGILLRSCLMDSIIGLYVLNQEDEKVDQLMELWNRDYVNALFEEFEVYRDKIKFAEFDDLLAEHMYTMSLEDAFISYLDLNHQTKVVEPKKERFIWKAIEKKEIYPSYNNEDNGKLKQMMIALSHDSEFEILASNLYAYYKYFSQYAHFSELGNGDANEDFGKDNIQFELTFDYIKDALSIILRNDI